MLEINSAKERDESRFNQLAAEQQEGREQPGQQEADQHRQGQRRPDLAHPRDGHLAEIGTRLAREIPSDKPAHFPVNAVLAGRRNNPPDLKAGIPPLAVYSPIHYQELPELFMDFTCSLTGRPRQSSCYKGKSTWLCTSWTGC